MEHHMGIGFIMRSKHITESECIELLKERGVQVVYMPIALIDGEQRDVLGACQKLGLISYGRYLLERK